MNPKHTISSLFAAIQDTMHEFGDNTSKYPFDFAHHSDKWWVTIEIDSACATVDLERSDADPIIALSQALASLRRELSLAKRAA